MNGPRMTRLASAVVQAAMVAFLLFLMAITAYALVHWLAS